MASTPDQEADQMAAAATSYDQLGDGEIEQELDSDFPDIPTSSKQLKNEKADAERKENKHGMPDNLKSTLLFSGVVIAVVGAIFAVLRKIREA
ncbi:unnamed protein product [Coffea canephora]|uniref:Uncharacterized protein n=1 Tax=Coffea canephora TaxID=49390 RepID=A0A068UGX8_COFCA|nr:unnamed protein product [Coffea canephora]